MTLTKNLIVEQVQAQLGFPNGQSKAITETLLELVKSSLATSENVLVSAIGKFYVSQKEERRGRNPATEGLMAPARRVATLKCSGELRDKHNDK